MSNSIDTNESVSRRLCAILADGIDVHRMAAAKALGKVGHEQALATLVAALRDEDEDVRSDASGALLQLARDGIRSEAVVAALLENLIGDPVAQVKLNAVDALAVMKSREALPLLRRLIVGRAEDEVVWDEEEYAVSGWDDWTDVRHHAIVAVADMGDRGAVGSIAEALEDPDSDDISEVAFRALSRLMPEGAGVLAGYLDSADARRRRRAAGVLGGVADAAADAAIGTALRHEDADVRFAAARALAERNPADQRLRLVLADAHAAIRANMIGPCLARHGEMLPLLLDDPEAPVRQAVYELLVRQPDLAAGIPELPRLEDDMAATNGALAAAAVKALSVTGDDDVHERLSGILADENRPAEVRLAAMERLVARETEGVVDRLAAILGTRQRSLRLKAMARLAQLASSDRFGEAAVLTLLDALRGVLVAAPEAEAAETEQAAEADDEPGADEEDGPDAGDEESGQDTAGAAGDETGKTVFPASTLDAILSGEPVIKEALDKKSSGAGLSPQDMDFLQLARDQRIRRGKLPPEPDVAPHQDVRFFAAQVLGDVARVDVAEALATTLAADAGRDLRLAAATSLANLAGRLEDDIPLVGETLLKEVDTPDSDTRLEIIRALGGFGGEAATDKLMELARNGDNHIRAQAIYSLGRRGAAGPDLATFLGDAAANVRLAAAREMAAAGTADLPALINFALCNEGYHCQEAGRLLAGLDRRKASELLLAILDSEDRNREWQVAIETLEAMHAADGSAPAV
ncbi:MAG TPA: HEAT repeat domain-containing protein [Rhodobacteraceae bacterium]|nr:HEAT repeat domain-containing protein [Paracoccaceae bacterium]